MELSDDLLLLPRQRDNACACARIWCGRCVAILLDCSFALQSTGQLGGG